MHPSIYYIFTTFLILLTAVAIVYSIRAGKRNLRMRRQIEKMRSDFFSSMTHELHTPLTILLGYSHELRTLAADTKKDHPIPREKVSEIATVIERQGTQLLQLIDQLLQTTSTTPEAPATPDEAPAAPDEAPAAPKAGPSDSDTSDSPSTAHILLVENDLKTAHYVEHLLDQDYRISIAGNGREAIDIAHEELPDLIITELSMPEMDGYELCKAIKKDQLTNHLPIIILTDKTAEPELLHALQAGADSYIPKPFKPEFLLARIDNILQAGQRLRQKYFETLTKGAAAAVVREEASIAESVAQAVEGIRPSQREFMNLLETQANRLIRRGFFDTQSVADALCMSRSQLNRKVKAITNAPTSDFLLRLRLRHSRHLLLDPSEPSIGEVAFQCGFDSSNYFSRIFKQYYLVTPTQYRKNQRQKAEAADSQHDSERE